MSGSSRGYRRGIGFCGALGAVLVGLKLAKVIDWPWWQVLMPLWVPYAVILLALTVVTIGVAIVKLGDC